MLTLNPAERRALRAQAHYLNPVVMIGQQGLTATVLREIDRALNAHELIKVRIFNDDRAGREAMQLAVCEQLACAPVQHLGKLIVLWRPAPPKKAAAPKVAKCAAKRPAKKASAKKALPGAINRRGQAIKPLSARQAREQAYQASEYQESKPYAGRRSRGSRQQESDIRDQGVGAGFKPARKESGFRDQESKPYAGRRSSFDRTASGKAPFQQTKPATKPPARRLRNLSDTPRLGNSPTTTRRRLGGRGKA
jgi:putative YhbY family RNA-binding protein